MTPKKPSLAEFADANVKPTCKVCPLPEREEIDSTYRSGKAKQPIILRWLHEVKGYNNQQVAAASLEKHFKNRHHYGS